MSDKFRQFLTSEGELTKDRVSSYFQNQKALFASLSFENTHKDLNKYVQVGGKYARPTLSRLAYQAIDGNTQGDLLLGTGAIEVFHRFILCHDDIIDQDMMRHDHPTMEKLYHKRQENKPPPHPVKMYAKGMAIVDGDILHSIALHMVRQAGFNQQITLNVIQGFHDCIISTAAGWKLETKFKQQAIVDVSQQQITQAMRLVSGHYSVLWPLRFGQLFAGQKYSDWNPWLEEYGENVGIAFQIQDDILGMFGRSDVTGKPVGSDYREAKKTLLLHHTYSHVSKKEQEFLEANLGSEDGSIIRQVQGLMETSGAIAYTRSKAQEFVSSGLKSLPKNNETATKLQQLADFLIKRQL